MDYLFLDLGFEILDLFRLEPRIYPPRCRHLRARGLWRKSGFECLLGAVRVDVNT